MKCLTVLFILILFLGCKRNEAIQADPASAPIRVYNKGVSGDQSVSLISRLDRDVISLKPNLVIIMIGTNDASRYVTNDIYRNNVSRVINSIYNAGIRVLLMSPPPRGIDTADVNSYLNQRTNAFTAILDTLSKSLKCDYIDINKAFKDAGTPNATASSMLFNKINKPTHPDGIHLTDEGMFFIAKAAFNYLTTHMQRAGYLTIVCLGDSLTYGDAKNEKSYPSQLQLLLNK